MENIANNLTVQSENASPENTSDVVAFDYQSNHWIISEEISDKTFEINFTERFNSESEWQISVAKAVIYARCIEFEGVLKSKSTTQTDRGFVYTLTTLFENCKRYFDDKYLSEYNEHDLLKIVTYHRDEEKLKAFSTVQISKSVSDALWELRFSNHLTEQDYLPAMKISERWPELVAKYFAPDDFNLTDWMHGGSFDIVPFEVSLAILTYCIEILRSDELKYFMAWCDMLRNNVETSDFIQQRPTDTMLSNFGKICLSSKISKAL